MRSRSILATALALAFASSAAGAATSGAGQLENVKGKVAYQQPHAAPNPLAVNASIALSDADYTIIGVDSLGQLTLPDSSRVMMGAETKVKIAFFNQAAIANAKFVLYHGTTRFAVIHPKGSRANYTFATPTADVSVRGTQGDIGYDPDGTLRVNVYEVCDANLPVEVTTSSGKTYAVHAGQSLLARLVNGVVRAQVEQLTQQLVDQFAPQFGVPTSWDAAKGEVVAYARQTAAAKAASAADAATGGAASTIASAVGGLFGHHRAASTPAPSPTPTSATCR